MKLPFVLRSTMEREVAERDGAIKSLRNRIFTLRDNMNNAKNRIGSNLRLVENSAAYRVLDMALIRDLEGDARV